ELLDRVSALGHIGGCEIEPSTRRVQWTDECYRIHGLPAGPLTLDDALALYTRDSRDAFEAALARLAGGGPAERLELCFYRPGGQRVWVQVTLELERREDLPERFVALFRDISRERETSERIELLSHYDLLTGLPNRFLLRVQVEEAIADALSGDGSPLSLLLLDLDGFKNINDTFGYAAGDAMLKAVAGRLHAALSQRDLFGRLGGDEFMVMLRADAAQAEATGMKLIAALSEPLPFAGELLKAGASVGVAVLGADGTGFDELLRAAHSALRVARDRGRN